MHYEFDRDGHQSRRLAEAMHLLTEAERCIVEALVVEQRDPEDVAAERRIPVADLIEIKRAALRKLSDLMGVE